MSEIHHWVKEHPYMTMDEALLQETSRQLENLYEKGTYDDIRTPYYRATNNFERKINEVIAEQTHSLNIKNTEKKEREKRTRIIIRAMERGKRSGAPLYARSNDRSTNTFIEK